MSASQSTATGAVEPCVRVVWRDAEHGWLCESPDGVPLSEFKPLPGCARLGRLVYVSDFAESPRITDDWSA